MNRALGENQRAVLKALRSHKSWSDGGGGWVWVNRSTTIKIMQSLAKRGLVVADPATGVYRLTLTGMREAMVS